MRIRSLIISLLFACSIAHAGDTLSVTFSRLDSLVKAINMLYRLPPDTSGLSAMTTPLMTWNGTKWVAANGVGLSVGKSSFITLTKRAAVYISGALSTDYYIANWIHPTGSGDPADNGVPYVYAKTDSLIVFRATATTSALEFYYLRMR